MINMKGLTHFTIPVTDLQRSKEFYVDTLGFKFERENKHMVFVSCEDDFFVLTESENPIDPNQGDKHEIHTAFYVDADEYDRAI
ncbi:MAG: VOC family protein, partial [Proteobacteria bacterium]|nr:VOC family protein [Pseudomonadota bacterium]